jgi:hypothetical protein
MDASPPPLQPADREEVLGLLAYALGFSLSGKARRRLDAASRAIDAAEIYEHLARSGYVIMKSNRPSFPG